MTSATRRTKIAFLSVFLALLILPDLQMATNLIPSPLLVENRHLADPPSWNDDLIQKTKKARLWFQDHYGFRNILIRLKTQMDVSIFGTSDRVAIGEDGWLFQRDVMVEEDLVEKLSPREWQRILEKLKEMRATLADRGITLLIVTNEMKDEIYHEKLPPSLRDRPRRQHFRDFRAQLSQIFGDNYIDAEPILLAAKKNRQVFHKTDIHWNDTGAFELARTVVDRIAALEGRPLPFWHYPLNIEIRRSNGSEAMFMPTFLPPTEQALYIAGNYPQVAFSVAPKKGPFDSVLEIKAPDADVLPPIAWYGDSFSDGMERAGSRDYFQTYYRARRAAGLLPEVVNQVPNDTRLFRLPVY